MAERYTAGTVYRAACLTRSALNSYVTIAEGMALTDHPLIRRFVAGVYNTRPPMPRYIQVWDIGIVISYLRGLGETSNLSLKLLTLKLNALLSILTSQRISSLHSLLTSRTTLTRDGVAFVPAWLLKHHRQGKKIKPIVVKAYPADPQVCVVSTLRIYLDKRLGDSDQLLQCHRRPYGPASKDTIARWLKQVLKDSGVDTSVYSAHSYRGASTSAANRVSVPIHKILGRGQWSSEDTWRNHYHLPVEGYASEDEDYTEELLDNFRD